MSKIAVRGYTEKLEEAKAKGNSKDFRTPLSHSRVLVFDTETVPDQYQNLKIGSFQIFHNGCFYYEGLFYDPVSLSEKEIKTIEEYSRKYKKNLYLQDEFIDNVFYPEVFSLKLSVLGII